MRATRVLLAAVFFGGAALTFSGCGPKYPKCENDEHCADKGEFCVNGLCQQCRDNSHCEGPGMICSAGKCEQRPGYCDESTPCPGNQKCRDNECGPQCLDDAECGEGNYCEAGSCTVRPECGPNAINPTCPEGEVCVAGRCEQPQAQCGGDPVYFDFDAYSIRGDQRQKLDQVAACMRGGQVANIRLAGHADERGTEEYNLALGQRRADAAKRYLQDQGVPSNKLSTVSYGEERPAVSGSGESAWGRNRRVEIETN